jgi:hypothetical protein
MGHWLLALVVLVTACACGASAPQPMRLAKAPAMAPAEPAQEARSEPTQVQAKGLTGTLNQEQVHQTMEARQPELDRCIHESRRRLRLVSGSIRFSFKVGADGAVEDVHPLESDIGHHALESCILEVLAQTTFPRPAGLASARFDWSLRVEPAYARGPEALEPRVLDKVLRKHAAEIYQRCEVRRRRARFVVTAYISPGGRVLSAGAVPRRTQHADKVDCVLEELASLRVPKPKRASKVTFELR